MGYSLIKNVFPTFHNKENLENIAPPSSVKILESPPEPEQTEVFTPTPVPLSRPVAEINVHLVSVNHMYECIRCRNHFLKSLSFVDRNREIMDIFPYILIVLILIIFFKKL